MYLHLILFVGLLLMVGYAMLLCFMLYALCFVVLCCVVFCFALLCCVFF